MINGKLVIDAVTHAFDARPELADEEYWLPVRVARFMRGSGRSSTACWTTRSG